ncbi:hypothetical protein RintRC_2830 [Richelia intracellularis]|nr:hypothetical protein RintRC_2830 [Richelia intracellularis]
MQILVVIHSNYWKPGIGDPTFMGWFIFTAYWIASFLSIFYALPAERVNDISSHHCKLWWSLAILLLLRGLNKQLDLQSWLMITGKEFPRTQDWYNQRQIIHIWMITAIITAVFALVVSAACAIRNRNIWEKYWLALCGVLCLAVYVIIRAPFFHHILYMLHSQYEIFHINCILQSAGIVYIGVSAIINLRKSLTFH